MQPVQLASRIFEISYHGQIRVIIGILTVLCAPVYLRQLDVVFLNKAPKFKQIIKIFKNSHKLRWFLFIL